MSLSDKRIDDEDENANWVGIYQEQDVKEFIKNIKDLLGNSWYMDCVKDEIDKLAGGELCDANVLEDKS